MIAKMISSLSEKSHNMSDELAQRLLKSILEEVSVRSGRLLVWGVNPTCMSLLRELSLLGLLSSVVAIVDSSNVGKEIFHLKVIGPETLHEVTFDTLVVTDDAQKESALLEFSHVDSRFPRVIVAGTRHLEFSDPTFDDILESCPVKPRAFGYSNMLVHIYQSIRYLIDSKIEGAVAEFGVYHGGTSAFIAKTLRTFDSDCQIFGFDTFTGFPERKHVLDLFRERKYEFADYEVVKNYLHPLGVKLIKGDITDTFKELKGIPLMFTFFDTDNYTPTRQALELCYEQTVSGGILAFDHYYCDERWINTVGERIAAEQVLSKKNTFHLHGTGMFLKP